MGDTSSRETVPKRRYSKAVFRFGHRGFTNWYISSPAGRAWVHERYNRARTCDPFRAGFREDLACELEKDTLVFVMELRRGGSLSTNRASREKLCPERTLWLESRMKDR